jgi:hypothetical protein
MKKRFWRNLQVLYAFARRYGLYALVDHLALELQIVPMGVKNWASLPEEIREAVYSSMTRGLK